MRNVIFGIILLASMLLPQIAVADVGSKGAVVSFTAGTTVVVDNNVDVTYTGKTWKDAQGNNKYEYIARISQAPIYNDDGSAVDCSWHGSEDVYIIINNVFSAQVIGAYITTTYHGQSMSWNPIVLIDSKEYVAKGSPKVLAVDPINENYRNNTLEWDYGVCVRRVRVIEGMIQETWVFSQDPKGTVWIKDNATKSAGFTWAISPYAFDAKNNVIPINQYKQVSAKDMASAAYPVTIDPTEVYVTSASDCGMIGQSAVFNTVWTAASAINIYPVATNHYIGMQLGSGPVYSIYRPVFFFDTSALPDTATVASANVSIRGDNEDYSTADFNISIMNGMPTYPHDPVVVGDYAKTNYNATAGNTGYGTAGWSAAGWNNISMNASGISWISLIGTTKLYLVSSEDLIGSAPAGNELVGFWLYEKGAGYQPYLEVIYTSSGVPTVTTSPATYVTKTTAQLNGYLNTDGGEADTVSFNLQPWYNAGWRDCIEFTINASYVDADLTGFPVLVTGSQLNTTGPDFWTVVNSSGSDILFTNSAGTKLNRELVSIDVTNKSMECYVNVTAVDDTTDTKFYMYYNSSNISVYNESNSKATWDANYVGVWHMNDNPNTSAIVDSTVYGFNGTKKGANEPLQVTGNFTGDKAQQNDYTDDYIQNTTADLYSTNTSGTVDVMFKTENTSASATYLVCSDDTASTTRGMRFLLDSGGKLNINSRNGGTADQVSVTGDNRGSTWHLGTFISNGSAYYFGRDGVITTSVSVVSGLNSGNWTSTVSARDNLAFGATIRSAVTYSQVNISEIRISNINRSDSWVVATYNSLMEPTLFAPVTDVFTTTATQSKVTGDSWYTSQSGLTANTLYGYKAEAVNSYGSAWGAWVFFNTSLTLNQPTNMSCSGGADYIDLSWLKGGNSSNTYIRYKIGSYPANTADGNALALQSSVYYKHTGLLSGTSYYYTLWGEDGGNYSVNYSQMMCTTTVAAPTSGSTPLPTVNTSDWHDTPNGSVLENNPLYGLGNLEAAAISVPQSTWWMLVGLGGLIVTGLFIYTRSRNLLAALGAMIIFGVLMANMGLFPIWTMIVFGFIGIGFGWKELR